MKNSHKLELLYAQEDIKLHEATLEALINATDKELKENRSIPYLITLYKGIIKERKADLKQLERC